MDTIIYTVITNNYDSLNEINTKHRAICFTDMEISSDSWEIIKIDDAPKLNRKIKICPHLFLPKHNQNVWMDGNVVVDDIDELIKGKSGYWIPAHPDRKCLYDEGLYCISRRRDTEEVIMRQLNKYYYEGYPINNGLITASLIIRDDSEVNRCFGEHWWNEVDNFSTRDQISFNYVAWKLGFTYSTEVYQQGWQRLSHTKRSRFRI